MLNINQTATVFVAESLTDKQSASYLRPKIRYNAVAVSAVATARHNGEHGTRGPDQSTTYNNTTSIPYTIQFSGTRLSCCSIINYSASIGDGLALQTT